MIQSLPLIETGAAERFRLNDEHLALACASHSGEPGHVRAVETWLTQIGLQGDALACGAHEPFDAAAAHALIAAGQQASALHNNCSGKHAGFLTAARHLDLSTAAYVDRSHPIQRLVTSALGEMAELDLGKLPPASMAAGFPRMLCRWVTSHAPWRNLPHPSGSVAAEARPPGGCWRR